MAASAAILPILTPASSLEPSRPHPHMEPRTRERLTGAVILVALVVLLVPELLSGPKRSTPAAIADARQPGRAEAQAGAATGSPGAAPESPLVGAEPAGSASGSRSADPDHSAASVEEPPIRSYTLPLGDEPRSAALGEPGVAADVPPRSGGAEGPSQPAAPAATAAARPQPSPTPGADVPRPAAAAGTAARSAPEPAAPAAARATPRERTADPQRERAAEAHSGGTAHPSGAAHSSGRGWTVQLGSFGSRENADRLVHQLKLKGYAAFVSETVSHGHKWYRVRVGPEHDRAAAAAVAARLRATGHAGTLEPP
jgi:DedD protein